MNFKTLYSSFLGSPESRWIMKPENARILYQFVKEQNIKNVLDLGTGLGVSAAVVALALKEKGGDHHVDTVEQNDKCYELAQKMIPEELKGNMALHRIDPVVWNTDKIPYHNFLNFKELPVEPEGGYDMIITDGPGEFADGEHFINLPNGDVLKLLQEDKIKVGTFLFFDGRMKALGELERYYSSNFYTLEAINNRCNILERKDNPVKFFDNRYQMFKEMGYV